MDNYNNFSAMSIGLVLVLRENKHAENYYNNLDDEDRAELNRKGHEFQSQEELERYLYYLDDNQFK